MSYHIQVANANQIKLMINWARLEGWNPGLKDEILFPLVDPAGFFIGLLDNKPINAISNVKYSNDFSFLGLYIVEPSYRHQGFGYQIWQHALKCSGNANCGLDGVASEQVNYIKSGFKLAHRNIRYKFINQIFNYRQNNLILANRVSVDQILNYDKSFFPASRKNFLPSWVNSDKAESLLYQDNNQILGYGVIRRCYEGYKIGPLFANSIKIAESILYGLCSMIKLNELIYLDTPELNLQAKQLVESLGMQMIIETSRMYNKYIPDISLNRTCGITSFEIGLINLTINIMELI